MEIRVKLGSKKKDEVKEKRGIFSRLKFWQKDKTGKRAVMKIDARQAQDRNVRLESFLNEECKNKCFMCPSCIKKLEAVVK